MDRHPWLLSKEMALGRGASDQTRFNLSSPTIMTVTVTFRQTSSLNGGLLEAITGHQGCETQPNFAGHARAANSSVRESPLKPLYLYSNMLGMDYLSPISPEPESKNRYIPVMVDYFPRHCWARAVKAKSGAEAVRAITDTSRTFAKPAEMPQFYRLISLRKWSNRPFAQRDLDGNSVWLRAGSIQVVRTACAVM